jgi:hypothetical protein
MDTHKHIILVLASPGFGSIDNWLPVMKGLKHNDDFVIYIVFPEKSSLVTIKSDSQLFKLSEILSDGVLFKTYANNWIFESSLYKSKRILNIGKADKVILSIVRRLTAGALSNIYLLNFFGRMLDRIFILKEKIRLFLTSSHSVVNNLSKVNNVSAILYDITVESKLANRELLEYFKSVPKFSILHGVTVPYHNETLSNCYKKIEKRSDVVVYPYSFPEVKGYQSCYGIDERNIFVTGIIRHNKDWINYVIDNFNLGEFDQIFDNFVLIIGRPVSPFNPPDRYKRALKNINKIICNELGKKILIKTHPKEDCDGAESRIYYEVFGKDNYGITWCFSDAHPFLLGKKCNFSISFYSSVPIDLIAMGKLTIEYLDLRGLKRYDNVNSLRDGHGHPVFPERYSNLVLGASNEKQFRKHIQSIESDYDLTFSKIKSKYDEYFSSPKDAVKIVVKDIRTRIL